MKKLLIIFVFLLTFVTYSNSQTYISIAPSLTNLPGTIAYKSNLAIEVGKQWDVFSLGLDIGKTTLARISGRDTSNYVEIRPNLNIFQSGKFTNTFTAGIGYVFNAKENLLTEVTYGIEYTMTTQIHLNMFFGNFYYSGLRSVSDQPFFGVSVAYYFKPSKHKSLINR